ncbi:MAG TPA: nuclease-related domain-containing protein [Syntrophomonadaceae bacterium]|nr:nuclease-related domain-containing protein [Syntrophomonadaceae bacterium]
MDNLILICPIVVVLLLALFFIYKLKLREKEETKKQIIKSGDRGEFKVQHTLRVLDKPNSRYKVYHNVNLGPDPLHTNEYDTVIIGPNGIFHIETKNYGGERGGIIDIDNNGNWILHKKNGHSKLITNPAGQVDSHQYRLKGFMNKVVGVRNLPIQGIIVLSCDNITLRYNQKTEEEIPIVNRKQLVGYIKHYNKGKKILYPRTIDKICRNIESMNSIAKAN